jgi:hypothetical protein
VRHFNNQATFVGVGAPVDDHLCASDVRETPIKPNCFKPLETGIAAN